MKSQSRLLYNSTLVLAVLSTGLLLFNMVAMVIYKQPIFFEDQGMLSSMKILILIGFILIPFFDIVSIGWLISRLRRGENAIRSTVLTLSLGDLCLVLLIGDKVMIDEIGREYLLHWEVAGEWSILYGLLTIQLVYNIVIFMQLFRVYKEKIPDKKV